MKNLILILILLLTINTANATTVHRWEKEVNDVCVKYLTTDNTPRQLFQCLIKETKDPYYWRTGWEKPVDANVMGILTLYQPEVVTAPDVHKVTYSEQYRWAIPQMYTNKLKARKNADVKFTQSDINRIRNAR